MALTALAHPCSELFIPRYPTKAIIAHRGRAWMLEHQGSLRLDIRKYFFTGRVVKLWNWLPRDVEGSQSREMLAQKNE